jgi:hypothetical protein
MAREELMSAGIYYPPTEPASVEGQHSLAWDILKAAGTNPWRWGDAYVSWAQALGGAERAGAHTLLVSSEYFTAFADWGLESAAFCTLRNTLGDVPVTLVFGLRDPLAVVPSHWQQGVKWGVGEGEEALSLDAAIPILLQRSGILVRPFIELAMAHLAPVRVRFFTVPRRRDGRELLKRFGQAAGVHEPLLTRFADPEREIKNESLSEEDCRVLLALNKILVAQDATRSTFPERGSPDKLEARSVILERLQLRADPGSDKRPIEVTGTARTALVQLRTEILSWVAQRGFDLYGSLDDLGSEGTRPEHGPAARPRGRGASPTRRAVELLADAVLSQTTALKELAAAKEWHEQQAETWERGYRQLAESLEQLSQEAGQLTAARDWHRQQSENWEREARSLGARIVELTRDNGAFAEARNWHRQESAKWQEESERLGAHAARLTEECRRLSRLNAELERAVEEVITARDWHQVQGENWRREWENLGVRVEALTRLVDDLSAARDWHRGQSENWEKEADYLQTRVAALTQRVEDLTAAQGRGPMPPS